MIPRKFSETKSSMALSDKHAVEVWGGMECSINRVQDNYFDQIELSGHRRRESDIELFASLGIKKIRYPIIWENHQPYKNEPIDWDQTTSKLQALRSNHIQVIAGLVHHGCGPNFVDIIDNGFAEGLAEYAGKVAERFPWIEYYTPVNEPLTTARFSGLYGLWHPHERNDAIFCRILVNECKATVLAMAAIKRYNQKAKLIQTDDLGKVHSTPNLKYQADFENDRRWLSFDLLCGRVNPDHALWEYLICNKITTNELQYFLDNRCVPDIIGVNYYLTSERYLDSNKEPYPPHTHGGNNEEAYADVEAVRVGDISPDGLQLLLQAAWKRYGVKIAITEVHLHCTREEQMRWLNEAWTTANYLIADGIPIIAITPWALLGSFGWDKLLTQPAGTYETGVFDISNGTPRPTILAKMIKTFSENSAYEHPALNIPGWWCRSSRVLYGDKFLLQEPIILFNKPLHISGRHADKLALVCCSRCLSHTIISKLPKHIKLGKDIWASIVVDDYVEVKVTGRLDLVIVFAEDADLHSALNIAIDLFLDEESGFWSVTSQGKPCKTIPECFSEQHFLAS